ncbi:venom peptide isomerase heavy chain-like isoform X2 [Haemaphysalis longicornis]
MGAATVVMMILLTISAVDAGGRARRESCRARHLRRENELTDGRCMPLQECLESLQTVRKLKLPMFCGLRGLLPIVCCPNMDPPPTAAPPPPPVVVTPPPSLPVIRNPPADAAPCTVEGSGRPGRCVPLDTCGALVEAVRRKQFPSLCDLKDGVAHACCPTNSEPAVAAVSPVTTPRPPLERAIKIDGLKYENGKYCGKTPNRPGHIDFRPVVHGGKDAELGAYPFMAAVFRDNVRVLNFWCGGTLIARRVILSAAHCFHNYLLDNHYVARIGGVNISDVSSGSFVEREVVSVHVHPDFDERLHYNDVALLFLNRSVLPAHIRHPFACLPEAGSVPDANAATVLGWGHDTFGGRLQTVLQQARIPLIDNQLCERRYEGLSNYADKFPRGINGDFLCGGNLTNGGVDACQQDSGGPLLTNSTRDGRNFFEAIGVVSFGVGCGSASYPGVYSRVSNYVDWILNVMADVLPDETIFV